MHGVALKTCGMIHVNVRVKGVADSIAGMTWHDARWLAIEDTGCTEPRRTVYSRSKYNDNVPGNETSK